MNKWAVPAFSVCKRRVLISRFCRALVWYLLSRASPVGLMLSFFCCGLDLINEEDSTDVDDAVTYLF